MCMSPDTPAAVKPGAAPAAPLATARNLKMNERPKSKDGAYSGNTARSRRTLRTDVKMSGGAGSNIPRMS
jgi:hypothetical protein